VNRLTYVCCLDATGQPLRRPVVRSSNGLAEDPGVVFPHKLVGESCVTLEREFRVLAACCASSGLPSSAHHVQRTEITRNEGFLLRTSPSLDLAFSCDRGPGGILRFGIHESHRPPYRGESAGSAVVVPGHATFEIARHSDIQLACRTAQDVDVLHRTTMPSSGYGFKWIGT
jgi:hypothetical protein